MSATLPVAIADALVGAVIPQAGRLRFAATDPRLQGLDGAVFDSPAAARHLAEAMLAARPASPAATPGALPRRHGR